MRGWLPTLATGALGGLAAVQPSHAGDTKPQPLQLVANKPVEIVCSTRSVVVATDAANASSGQIRLSLVLKESAAKPATGAWRIVSVEPAHAGSFATPAHRGNSCAESCPLTMSESGQIQLWSPAPKGLSQLAADEVLLLAVIKPKTLELTATTFLGPNVDALEKGQCHLD